MNEVVEQAGTVNRTDANRSHIQASDAEISMLDILVLLVKNRTFLLRVTCVCAVIAIVVALRLPTNYTAMTTLLPPQQSSSFSSSLLSQLGGASGGLGSLASASGLPGLKNPADLYVGLLRSETVENAMVHRYNLQQEYKAKLLSSAREALEGHVLIDGNGKDGLIRISVRARTPVRAAELANGYIEQYRQLSESLAIGEASQRRLFLERQMQKTKDSLAKAEENLEQTEQATGLIQLDSQARALIESAVSIRAQLAAKEVQVQSMQAYAGAGNVDLMQAQRELIGLRAQLAKLGGAGDQNDSELVPSKGRIPQVGLEYVRKLREVKYNETLFDILARQYEAAKLDEAKEGAMVQVVDIAIPPDKKSGPPRALIVIGGVALGFIGAIGWILFGELRKYLHTVPEYAEKLRAAKRHT